MKKMETGIRDWSSWTLSTDLGQRKALWMDWRSAQCQPLKSNGNSISSGVPKLWDKFLMTEFLMGQNAGAIWKLHGGWSGGILALCIQCACLEMWACALDSEPSQPSVHRRSPGHARWVWSTQTALL